MQTNTTTVTEPNGTIRPWTLRRDWCSLVYLDPFQRATSRYHTLAHTGFNVARCG